MLANLSISKWGARKFDRKATQEVDTTHAAKGAGRYNKLLVEESALKPIQTAESALRKLHDRLTLPWSDNGERLLPSKLFLDYTQQMRVAKDEFEKVVADLVRQYPGLVQAARNYLGTLYNPQDYPADISDKFSVSFSFMPVPKAGDFRVDVGAKDLEKIRAEITETVKVREAEATNECWTRVRAVVGRYAERLRDEKSKVFQTMIDDAKWLVLYLPALNIANDQGLNTIAKEIDDRLLCANVTTLRTNMAKRAEIVAAAENILSKMP